MCDYNKENMKQTESCSSEVGTTTTTPITTQIYDYSNPPIITGTNERKSHY